jgi:hypothetical protein
MISPRLRRLLPLLAAVALTLFAISRLPPRVDGSATIGVCPIDRNWPVIQLDAGTERYLPVAAWPTGLRFDLATGQVLDASGRVAMRSGDRVVVTGSIVDVHGDPSPCYFTRGIEIDRIAPVVTRTDASQAP